MKRYSEDQIKQANSIDLVSYLRSQGYELIPEGRQFKLAEHDSLYVRGNQWYWFSQSKGGKTLAFLIDYEGKPFLEAMYALVGEPLEVSDSFSPRQNYIPREPLRAAEGLMLPLPAPNNEAVFSYLKSRGIDARKIKALIDRGNIYQTNMFWQLNPDTGEYEARSCPPSVVFVGKDEEGLARYACTRSVTGDYKHDAVGSDKSYAFYIPDGNSKAVWVFESAIDALSHATLSNYAKTRYSAHRVSLGGVSPAALMRFLDTHPDVCYINLALDNDQQGRQATEQIRAALAERFGDRIGNTVMIYDHPPMVGKDYNEELLFRQQQYRERREAQQQPTQGFGQNQLPPNQGFGQDQQPPWQDAR